MESPAKRAECTICFSRPRTVRLSCGHAYCEQCTVRVFSEERFKCPMRCEVTSLAVSRSPCMTSYEPTAEPGATVYTPLQFLHRNASCEESDDEHPAYAIARGHAIVPDGVTVLASDAFCECYSLTSIALPTSLVTIGRNAFCNCYCLRSITLPDGLAVIGADAFSGCFSLASITLPESVREIGDSAFLDCSALTTVVLPPSLPEMSTDAFRNCAALTSITLPPGLTGIDIGAFGGCAALTSITLPEGVKLIALGAFSGCAALASITLPEGLEVIGKGVLDGPEDIIIDDEGNLFAGTRKGEIYRFFGPDFKEFEVFAHTGGRPFGITVDRDGSILCCVAGAGLYRITKDREIIALSTQTQRSLTSIKDDSRVRMADDLDVAPDGRIFYTDPIGRYDASEWLSDALEGRGTGRLLCFDPADGSTKTLQKGLLFANGD